MSRSGRIRTALLRVSGDIWTWSLSIDGRVVEVGGRQSREQAERAMKDRRALWALAERFRLGVERTSEDREETAADRMIERQIKKGV